MKVIHSDCLEAMRSMEDNSIDAIVMDPPANYVEKITIVSLEELEELYRIARHNSAMMVFCNQETYILFLETIKKSSWHLFDCIAYIKNTCKMQSEGHKCEKLLHQFEPIFLCIKEAKKTDKEYKPYKSIFQFEVDQPNIIYAEEEKSPLDSWDFFVDYSEVDESEEKKLPTYPYPKHIKTFEKLLKMMLPEKNGKVLLNPYCGTGEALIAASVLDIDSIGIEIDSIYAQIARKRLENFSCPMTHRSMIINDSDAMPNE